MGIDEAEGSVCIMSLRRRIKRRELAWLGRCQSIFFIIFHKKRLPIGHLLEKLKELEYVVLKADVPYMPSNFPATYPLGKDLDVLVSEKCFLAAVSVLDEFRKESGWHYGVKVLQDDFRVKVRFLWCGILHYQIDCAFDLELNGLEAELLKQREWFGSFFKPALRVELLYRLLEYRDNPSKIHHLDNIKTHIDKWDVSLACRYGIALPFELEKE